MLGSLQRDKEPSSDVVFRNQGAQHLLRPLVFLAFHTTLP
jgi:hypothetical protein